MDETCSKFEFCVHQGMYDALHPDQESSHIRSEPTIVDEIVEDIKKMENFHEIIICGHSLGAGYAILVYLELITRYYRKSKVESKDGKLAKNRVDQLIQQKKIKVITFGAPCVVAHPAKTYLREWWKEASSMIYCYVNALDPIPRHNSPTWLLGVVRRAFQPYNNEKIKRFPGVNTLQNIFQQVFEDVRRLHRNVKLKPIGHCIFINTDDCGTSENQIRFFYAQSTLNTNWYENKDQKDSLASPPPAACVLNCYPELTPTVTNLVDSHGMRLYIANLELAAKQAREEKTAYSFTPHVVIVKKAGTSFNMNVI
mmetsp:Transcript_24022/g.58120  ORF Transcript_24022/g.58120 Transcript_24022/m.58120 type:complete len:312 (+) Transcript_24022:762-1697(+)